MPLRKHGILSPQADIVLPAIIPQQSDVLLLTTAAMPRPNLLRAGLLSETSDRLEDYGVMSDAAYSNQLPRSSPCANVEILSQLRLGQKLTTIGFISYGTVPFAVISSRAWPFTQMKTNRSRHERAIGGCGPWLVKAGEPRPVTANSDSQIQLD